MKAITWPDTTSAAPADMATTLTVVPAMTDTPSSALPLNCTVALLPSPTAFSTTTTLSPTTSTDSTTSAPAPDTVSSDPVTTTADRSLTPLLNVCESPSAWLAVQAM